MKLLLVDHVHLKLEALVPKLLVILDGHLPAHGWPLLADLIEDPWRLLVLEHHYGPLQATGGLLPILSIQQKIPRVAHKFVRRLFSNLQAAALSLHLLVQDFQWSSEQSPANEGILPMQWSLRQLLFEARRVCLTFLQVLAFSY